MGKQKGQNIENKYETIIAIPNKRVQYVSKDAQGNIVNTYRTTFSIQILLKNSVRYIVNLYPSDSNQLITSYTFTTRRSSSNIKKNSL